MTETAKLRNLIYTMAFQTLIIDALYVVCQYLTPAVYDLTTTLKLLQYWWNMLASKMEEAFVQVKSVYLSIFKNCLFYILI